MALKMVLLARWLDLLRIFLTKSHRAVNAIEKNRGDKDSEERERTSFQGLAIDD